MRIPADERAAAAVVRHHAAMLDRLTGLTTAVLNEVTAGRAGEPERTELVAYLRSELIPHAKAEEETLYATGAERPELGPLVSAMRREHEALLALVAELAAAPAGPSAAAQARAVAAVFSVHLDKENDLLLPALLAAPEVSLADLLEGMHALLGGQASEANSDLG